MNPVMSEMNAATDDDMIYRLFLHNISLPAFVYFESATAATPRGLKGPSCSSRSTSSISTETIVRTSPLRHRTSASPCPDPRGRVGTTSNANGTKFRTPVMRSRFPSDTSDYITLDGNGFHPGVTRAVAEQFGPVPAWDGFWAVTNWSLSVHTRIRRLRTDRCHLGIFRCALAFAASTSLCHSKKAQPQQRGASQLAVRLTVTVMEYVAFAARDQVVSVFSDAVANKLPSPSVPLLLFLHRIVGRHASVRNSR